MPWGDQKILDEIIRQSRREFSDPRVRRIAQRAAVQTGIVETGGRNLNYGDADSQGWRQERASLYKNPTNVRASVARFLQEFKQQYDPGERSFDVAAQVQRPAAQYRGRYGDVRGEANRILRNARGGAPGGGGGRSGGAGGLPGAPGTAGARGAPQGSEGLVALLAELGGQKPAVQSAGLQGPAHSAGAAMPAGYQAPASGGGPAPKADISGLLSAIRTVGGDVEHGGGLGAIGAGGQPGGASRGGGGALRGGRVRIAPGADRAGVNTRPSALAFAKAISAQARTPVTVGTGTAHSRLSVSGNVSDHWEGHATDIPAAGRKLIRLGQAALIAAGADPKWARKQTGGLYNLPNGAQIIFNTQEGGDHTDHLHANPPDQFIRRFVRGRGK